MKFKYECQNCGEVIIRHVKYPMFMCPRCSEIAPRFIEDIEDGREDSGK